MIERKKRGHDRGRTRRHTSALIAALEAPNLHPLWDRYKRITPIPPRAKDPPFLWRWRDVEPILRAQVARCRSRTPNGARSSWPIRPSTTNHPDQ